MKNENEAGASLNAELMRLVRDDIERDSGELNDLTPNDPRYIAEAAKLKKLRALCDAYHKKRAAGFDWRRIAKLAAHDLKAYQGKIFLAAQAGEKRFFIDLGKCLSGEMKSGYDRLDADMALILSHEPSIKAGDAVRVLARRGHPRISEENFRMRKKRLKALARSIHEREEAHVAEASEWAKAMNEVLAKNPWGKKSKLPSEEA